MKKIREYDLHDEFLTEYENAAIANAQQILKEAKILLAHRSFARAYFLAVASIEETGKAYIAFSSKGRNLSDKGLKERIQKIFESHSQKISSAFIGWITKASNPSESIKAALELMVHLKLGREKSMYVDAKPDNSISIPMRVIRPAAAIDSVKVAENCLYHTKQYLSQTSPPSFSSFDEKFFCLRTDKINEIFNTADFGKYILFDLKKEGKHFSLAKAIVTYHDRYFCKKMKFSEKES